MRDKHMKASVYVDLAAYEALRKDAERYRWLKDSEMLVWPSVDLSNACHRYAANGDTSLIDRQIDRMMASTPQVSTT